MSALIYSTQTPFGGMTSAAVAQLAALNTKITRLGAAIATASSGLPEDHVEGTQFENSGPGQNFVSDNLFGVTPSETPGEQGTEYRYAVDQLRAAWDTFWPTITAYVTQLDQGQQSL